MHSRIIITLGILALTSWVLMNQTQAVASTGAQAPPAPYETVNHPLAINAW